MSDIEIRRPDGTRFLVGDGEEANERPPARPAHRPSEVVMQALERIVADYDLDADRMAHVLADFHQWLESGDDSPLSSARQNFKLEPTTFVDRGPT